MSSSDAWITEFKEDQRYSGIFLDFDGTISDISTASGEARLNPAAEGLLSELSRRYPMCVMSGRRAAEVASIVGLPRINYIGLHGMEWMEEEPHMDPEVLPHLPTLNRAREELRTALAELSGVSLEDKLASLSLHFREAPDTEEEVVRLAEGVADNLGLKLRQGRMALELLPPVDIDKGTALIRLARGWRLKRALYAGDDMTDVDGFRGLRYLMKEGDFDGVAIAVLSDETPIELEAVADITVEGPEGLLSLLSRL
jgi:trehalose 6-phosphate phosphatase